MIYPSQISVPSVQNLQIPPARRYNLFNRQPYNHPLQSIDAVITELAIYLITFLALIIASYSEPIGNAIGNGIVYAFNKVCCCSSSEEDIFISEADNPLILDEDIGLAYLQAAVSSATLSRPHSENIQQNRQHALDRLNTIKNRLNSDHPIQFGIVEQIIRFNLDAELARYDKNTPIQNLLGLLDFAGPSPVQARVGRPSAQQEHIERCSLLNDHLLNYSGWIEGRNRTVRESLSQLSNIWADKKRKIAQYPFPTFDLRLKAINDLKTEIRTHCEAINDAHENCIDQVSGQIESILLDVIASELAARGQISKAEVQARLALFRYRADLIKQMTYELYPNEPHMADLERMVKSRNGHLLGLNGNAVLQGAQYEHMVVDASAKIRRISEAVRNQYRSLSGNPMAYLQRELKTYAGANLARNLRSVMIQQVNAALHIDSAYNDDYEITDLLVKEIVQAASREGQDVFQFHSASDAGVLWLMEEAGLIREI